MQFSQLMKNIECSEGNVALELSPEWMQGRAVFGGLQTVIALRAMRTLVTDIPVRSLQTTFIAPPSTRNVTAQATILRRGKSATHVEARLMEGENLLALVVGVFGAARPSEVVRHLEMAPVECETPKTFRYFPGKSPTFTQHFSVKWLQGGMPFSGKQEPLVIVEVAMPGETESSEYHAVAVADFIPPVGLSYLKTPVPGSSMTWMLEFLCDDLDGLPMEGWRVDAELVAAADGYTNQSVMIWGPGGKPIALSRQTMVVFG